MKASALMSWLVLAAACRTPAKAVEPRPLEPQPPELGVDQPCDMPGNPREPVFVSLETMLSVDAKALLSQSTPCLFQRDERDVARTMAQARAYCGASSNQDPQRIRAACRELCVAQLDWSTFHDLHEGMVATLARLASMDDCRAKPMRQQWACARGPKLPASFSFDHTDAGLPRVHGQFIDGGVEWRLEVTPDGACGRSFLMVQQWSPGAVCRQTNVQTCEASAL
jgi:hypothetical protein